MERLAEGPIPERDEIRRVGGSHGRRCGVLGAGDGSDGRFWGAAGSPDQVAWNGTRRRVTAPWSRAPVRRARENQADSPRAHQRVKLLGSVA